MNKVLIMLKMGWTEKQYYEDNTAEIVEKLTFVLEKMNKTGELDSLEGGSRGKAKGKVKVQIG